MEEYANKGYADLHTHTCASDGVGAPGDNVRLAYEAGLRALAITDHDTVAGLEEALEAGRRLGVAVVPGVEISTVAAGKDIHVLGYYIRRDDPVLLERLRELRGVRQRRNDMLLERLGRLGLPLSMEEVLAHREGSGLEKDTIGRPHIAMAMIAKGYVSSQKEAFQHYLGQGGAAYVNPPRIAPETAIQWIHEAGGAAVLAHPGLYGDDDLVEKLAASGLDGIEAYHSDHSEADAKRYADLAGRYGLAVTAGSDYHGERNGVVFHGPLGSRSAPLQVLEELQARAAAASARFGKATNGKE